MVVIAIAATVRKHTVVFSSRGLFSIGGHFDLRRGIHTTIVQLRLLNEDFVEIVGLLSFIDMMISRLSVCRLARWITLGTGH